MKSGELTFLLSREKKKKFIPKMLLTFHNFGLKVSKGTGYESDIRFTKIISQKHFFRILTHRIGSVVSNFENPISDSNSVS